MEIPGVGRALSSGGVEREGRSVQGRIVIFNGGGPSIRTDQLATEWPHRYDPPFEFLQVAPVDPVPSSEVSPLSVEG